MGEQDSTKLIQHINWSSVSIEGLLESFVEIASKFAIRLAIAVAVFIIGKWLINRLNVFFLKVLNKRNTEPSLGTFLKSLVNITLTIVLIIVIIGILGIETTSFVALFASVGVAFGMALSGTLQNFAGGFMILLFKPYKVGDSIEALGQIGTVKEIQIFNTVLLTSDNKVIFIPNGKLSTDVVINYSNQSTRRVDIIFNIAYGEDYDRAKNVIEEMIKQETRILKKPPYLIALNKLSSSSVDIVVRIWTAKEDYWDVYFNLNETIYKTFRELGIEIPLPQTTVQVKK